MRVILSSAIIHLTEGQQVRICLAYDYRLRLGKRCRPIAPTIRRCQPIIARYAFNGPGPAIKQLVSAGPNPEDLALVTNAAETSATIPCRVTLVEQMGASNLLIVQAGKQQLTVAAPADFYLPPGSNAALVVNPAKVHFFEANRARNITL